MYILVTGGAGYIGSHTVIELINSGYKVVVVDNLSNASYDSILRVEYIVKKHVPFFDVDLRNLEELTKVFLQYQISGVIHFAALKAVGELTKIPLDYYDNNVGGTVKLLEVMKNFNVKTIVFLSSATVYGDATRFEDMIPIPEHCPNDPTNPYGKTKYFIENIIHDLYTSDPTWQAAILRYFNPIGAHPLGLLGEDPLGIPNNLLPYLAQVAIGRREKLSIFGSDYDSHDGTPIRDYIHVVDLAKGHISSLKYLQNLNSKGIYREWNLGTGKGSTVFDVYHAFCKAVGRELPYEVVGRRAGDVLNLTANPSRANSELGWKADLTIEDACRDLWKWTQENPFGFQVKGYKWTELNGYANRLHQVEKNGFKFSTVNYGAAILKVEFNGTVVNIALESDKEFKSQDGFIGGTIGRYANRIARASYKSSTGEEVQLTKNDQGNCLHGGPVGFDKKTFFGPVVKNTDDEFTFDYILVDKSGSNGFPGDLETKVKYTVSTSSTEKAVIDVEYEAKLTSGTETPINLSNHSYWNISNDPTIDGTNVKLATDKVLKVDKELIPTGEIETLKVDTLGVFDTCFVLSHELPIDTRNLPMNEILSATHSNSPIEFKVSTTEPSFQLYTGDFLPTTEKFTQRSGFAVEPGRFIDAVNNKKYYSLVILKAGDVYGSRTEFSFSTSA